MSLIFKCSLSFLKASMNMCFNLNIVIDMWTLDVFYVNIVICDVWTRGLYCIFDVNQLSVSWEFEEWTWRSNGETRRSQNKSAYQLIPVCSDFTLLWIDILLLTAHYQLLRSKGCAQGLKYLEPGAQRLSPKRSDPGSSPARGHLLHVLPSISHTFLSISLSNIKALKSENKSLKK